MNKSAFRAHSTALALIAMSVAVSAVAAIDVGKKAPDFSAPAALDGKPFEFSLASSLAKGPVVLYFYPASFTSGCSAEAHAFAEATEKYAALGATVVGVSADPIATQLKFSAQDCQGKFPIAADDQMKVIKSYDAVLTRFPKYAERVSYVIKPDGTVLYVYKSMDPDLHVEKTLAALRDWKQSAKN